MPTELARDVINNLDSDDAADLINELTGSIRQDVLSKITDRNQAQNIADLLFYPENTAGGLMAKELIKVNIGWHVVNCIREMRAQAAHFDCFATRPDCLNVRPGCHFGKGLPESRRSGVHHEEV